MYKKFDDITGAELLRADIKSQQITIEPSEGEHSDNRLVSPEQFWGKCNNAGLFYNYLDASNTNGWTIERSGWNDFSQEATSHMDPKQTHTWIQNNVFNRNNTTFTVIQGYAGCGKTIFINSVLRPYVDDIFDAKSNDIYVDYDNESGENGYLVNSLSNKLATIFTQIMSKQDGLEIFEKFINYIKLYNLKGPSFFDVVSLYNEEGLVYLLLKKLYENRNDEIEFSKIKDKFQTQFICGTMLLGKKVRLEQKSRLINITSLKDKDDDCIKSLLSYYIAQYFLLLLACDSVRCSKPTIVLFDNLDIIDNPAHVAVFISKLQEILYRLKAVFGAADNPVINVIVAVRKITHAYIAEFMEVGKHAHGEYLPAKFLEISNLYSATQVLKHKAQILIDHIDDYIPAKKRNIGVENFLSSIVELPDDVLNEISISDLFNHNIRACANILERIHPKIDVKGISKQCAYSIWIHSICDTLNEIDIWRDLEFDTCNNTDGCFPASFSRLILTILYNRRKDYRKNRNGVTDVDVSLTEIAELLNGLPSLICKRSIPRRNKENDIKSRKARNARASIAVSIAQMLKRNSHSDGIDSRYEEELWRRPLYYTHNAFPLVDSNGREIIKEELEKQLNYKNKKNITSFCITDEGYTFIDKIVTSFEFFSVRVNGTRSRALFSILDQQELNTSIENVFNQVKETVGDHLWLMDYYINNKLSGRSGDTTMQKEVVNEYLRKEFHPKTEGNHPQLHVVRTIFDHIYALNNYRNYLINQLKPVNLTDLNRCLVRWIGRYLDLYRSRFYQKLNGTIGSFNNVFLDLKYLYWLVYTDDNLLPKDRKGEYYISIERNNPSNEERTNQNLITDNRLENEQMILPDSNI